jgi:hypothetical protein
MFADSVGVRVCACARVRVCVCVCVCVFVLVFLVAAFQKITVSGLDVDGVDDGQALPVQTGSRRADA